MRSSRVSNNIQDVVPGRSTEVLGGNYLIRYIFGAAGTSLALPAINAIGIGWFCTISTVFILATFGGLLLVIYDKVPRLGRRSFHVDIGEKVG